ncbi:MAG: NusG domain II-containing protein [Ruminococcaceae bacterium]|nr:NusG domain II-containing protein [Oscillospiraceae bacterium]
MNRKLITGLDVVLILLIIIAIVAITLSFWSSDVGNKVVITVNEEIIGEYSLSTNLTKEIKTEYGSNTLIISKGECYIINADCRDGICVSRGKISKIGESIVCLPHKMIVEIK